MRLIVIEDRGEVHIRVSGHVLSNPLTHTLVQCLQLYKIGAGLNERSCPQGIELNNRSRLFGGGSGKRFPPEGKWSRASKSSKYRCPSGSVVSQRLAPFGFPYSVISYNNWSSKVHIACENSLGKRQGW